MQERRLLERIASWETDESRTHQTRVEILVWSVKHHLALLLNTRQGSVQIAPLLGVPDFTHFADGAAVGEMQDIAAEIRRVVLRYEPRIKSLNVTFNHEQDDVLMLQFTLEGRLEVDQGEMPLYLSTTIGVNGRVKIVDPGESRGSCDTDSSSSLKIKGDTHV